MAVSELCPQAFIFLCFTLTQVTIDTIKGEYNKALFKFWLMIIFTLLLNNLCNRGLGIVSWTIIFMPFMLMSIVTAILLYVFGLDPTTGKLKYYTPEGQETIGVDSNRQVVNEANDENSKYARPVDLINYRVNPSQNNAINQDFTPESSNTSSAVTSQAPKLEKIKSDNIDKNTVVYKKDDNKQSNYCANT